MREAALSSLAMTPKRSVILVISLVTSCQAEAPAHVQSEYGQLVTSSTLAWARSGVGMSLPGNFVSSGTGDGVLCRGLVHGVTVAGFTSRSRCMVAGTGEKLISLTRYSVLTHVTNSSKLKWITYERFSPVPSGAVAGLDETGNNVFIGRKLDGGVMRTALLEMGAARDGVFGGRIAVYSVDDVVRLESQCDLLVEVEPVKYQLDILQNIKQPQRSSEKSVLATSTMFRFEEGLDSVARMTKMVSYTYEKSLYFGQIRGAIKGLQTKIKMPSGETRSMIWGRTEADRQTESMMVEYSMEKNTAIDIEILAEKVSEEQLWSGILVAIFADGSRRGREVEGVTMTRFLDMISPSYSQPHRIKQEVTSLSQSSYTSNVSLDYPPDELSNPVLRFEAEAETQHISQFSNVNASNTYKMNLFYLSFIFSVHFLQNKLL